MVGDIHGCFDKLYLQLIKIGFNRSVDRLFAVGDLIDRGPHSDRVLTFLDEPWFHTVIGNHERMTVNCYYEDLDEAAYVANGGQWFLDLPRSLQTVIVSVFNALPILIEVETPSGLVGIAHADCLSTRDDNIQAISSQPDKWEPFFTWSRAAANSYLGMMVKGYRDVFMGHTVVDKHVIKGNMHFIDNGAWASQLKRDFLIVQI